jgi:peptidoglycan/xylan/chitin deacetylase (PgdA/CDA1 family)
MIRDTCTSRYDQELLRFPILENKSRLFTNYSFIYFFTLIDRDSLLLLLLNRIKNNINVDFPIISLMLVLVIIPIGLHSTSLPTEIFGQSDDDNSSKDNEDNNTPDKIISNRGNSKFVILTFDDGYKSQYTTVKPILDKYGFKGTFYVVCNYAQKIDADRMNWTEIKELHQQGHDIGSHTMNHADLTQLPEYRIDYEIGTSKQCLIGNGINHVTSFAYPFAEGSTNKAIINTVAKYYPIARTADAPLMFLDCRGWNNDNDDGSDDISSTINSSTTQTDCREYSDDGRLNLVNRYTIRGWSHDSERAFNLFSDEYMLHRFIEVVDGQDKYNNNNNDIDDSRVSAIPIIIWHNIANNVKDDPYTTTSVDLFESEIKYLSDNGFTVLTMSDLEYDEGSNALKIKDKTLPAASLISVSHGNGDIDNREDTDDDDNDNVTS